MSLGRYEDAIIVLKQTLGEFLRWAQSSECLERDRQASLSSDSLLQQLGTTPAQNCVCTWGKDRHHGVRVFALYDKAFKIPQSFEPSANELPDYRAAAIVLYNIGLCYHMIGLRSEGQKRHLRLALKQYQCAETLLASDNLRPCDLHLAMAMRNNIGHIHSHFFETEQAHECLERLKSCILRANPPVATLGHEAFTDFGLTVLLNLGPNYIPPSPAA